MTNIEHAQRIIEILRHEFKQIPEGNRGTVIALVYGYFAKLHNKLAPLLQKQIDQTETIN